jgi:hypothetical protein
MKFLRRLFRRKRKRLINQMPDPRVSSKMQEAMHRILTGSVDTALVLWFENDDMHSATLSKGQDRATNIGMAQMYLMCQQAWITTELVQQGIDDDDEDEDDEETVIS